MRGSMGSFRFSIASRHGERAMLVALAFGLGLAAGASLAPATAERSRGPDALAEPAPEPSIVLRAQHRAEVLRVVDGDTFEARVQIWPGIAVTTRVRLRGIDAPELRARCLEERMKAEAARDALSAMLADGHVGIAQVTLDKYGGRVVADAATRTTPDVSAALLAAGLVRRYDGGRRESWCP
jgi:endonuclease YncB( thermonuclease family)